MKKIFEMPSITLENLQTSEAIMNEYWDEDAFALSTFPGNE